MKIYKKKKVNFIFQRGWGYFIQDL